MAAALAADRILTKAGPDLAGDPSPASHPNIASHFLADHLAQDLQAELKKRPGALRPWEPGFVTDLPRFLRLSTK